MNHVEQDLDFFTILLYKDYKVIWIFGNLISVRMIFECPKAKWMVTQVQQYYQFMHTDFVYFSVKLYMNNANYLNTKSMN